MKTTTLALILFLTGLDLWAQTPPQPATPPPTSAQEVLRKLQAGRPAPGTPTSAFPGQPGTANVPGNNSSVPGSVTTLADNSAAQEDTIPAGEINFQGVDLTQVLDVYAKYVGRTLIHGALPQASIVLKNETPLTRAEVIQALEAVIALNNVSIVPIGDKFVKVVDSSQAGTVGGNLDFSGKDNLPTMGSYVTHVIQLQNVKPSVMMPLIQPFAKLPNSIQPLDDNGILVLRDYAENVKRMLEMIAKIDVSVPAEYISEVIPIKYALAGDIANALNSLGGSGGATVNVGASTASAPISGFRGGASSSGGVGGGGLGGLGGTSGGQYGGANNQQGGGGFGNRTGFGSQGGGATPNGTPAAGTSFQQRLNAIINKASGPGQPDQIQVFGQTKIIADSRANALLVFATRSDMLAIKKVIGDLDVLLSQVLIESIIMDVSLNNSFNFGVSAVQKPQTYSPSVPVVGAGGFNNGQRFYDFVSQLASNGVTSIQGLTNGDFANSTPGGLSYFMNIGPHWDVAVTAAEQDNTANIIQRPRIQTSQAKQAQFFVGQTVPYITGTYYNGGYGGGNSSQYSQLSVGIELDVTPFINPEGLVVMDINQEIDDVSGYTKIDGNNVPNTDKRTLSSEIAVRDKDTIILGGFVRTDKSHSKSGVPFLQDIPLLGNLFTSRTDTKNRTELIVMMRPTVLRTPEISAMQTYKEKQKLPGVSGAAAAEAADERKLIEAERKRELKRAKSTGFDDGFFAVPPPNPNPPRPAATPEAGSYNSPPPASVPAAPASTNVTPPAAVAPPEPPPLPTPVPADPPPAPAPDNGFFYNDPPPAKPAK